MNKYHFIYKNIVANATLHVYNLIVSGFEWVSNNIN